MIGLGEINAQKFWSRVRYGADCWEWTGPPGDVGYGTMSVSGKQRRCHRIAWVLEHGAEPEKGLCVLHRCDNRLCVRPDHLFAGTHRDNIADMNHKGHGSRPPLHVGERHPQAKLTRVDVETIRHLLIGGAVQKELARRFSVTPTAINNIATGKTWRAA